MAGPQEAKKNRARRSHRDIQNQTRKVAETPRVAPRTLQPPAQRGVHPGPSRSSEIGKVLVTDDADALQPATRGLEASLSVPLDIVNHPGWSAVDWMT